MIDGIKIIIITNPFLWTLVIMVVMVLLGMLMGAWYYRKPLSDLELRVEHHVRETDEHQTMTEETIARYGEFDQENPK